MLFKAIRIRNKMLPENANTAGYAHAELLNYLLCGNAANTLATVSITAANRVEYDCIPYNSRGNNIPPAVVSEYINYSRWIFWLENRHRLRSEKTFDKFFSYLLWHEITIGQVLRFRKHSQADCNRQNTEGTLDCGNTCDCFTCYIGEGSKPCYFAFDNSSISSNTEFFAKDKSHYPHESEQILVGTSTPIIRNLVIDGVDEVHDLASYCPNYIAGIRYCDTTPVTVFEIYHRLDQQRIVVPEKPNYDGLNVMSLFVVLLGCHKHGLKSDKEIDSFIKLLRSYDNNKFRDLIEIIEIMKNNSLSARYIALWDELAVIFEWIKDDETFYPFIFMNMHKSS